MSAHYLPFWFVALAIVLLVALMLVHALREVLRADDILAAQPVTGGRRYSDMPLTELLDDYERTDRTAQCTDIDGAHA